MGVGFGGGMGKAKAQTQAGEAGSLHAQTRMARLYTWVLLLVAIAVVVVASLRDVVDPDILFHIRFGQEIIAQRAIVYLDQFSFTLAGKEWVNQSWLIDVLYALIYDRFGLGPLIWLKALFYTIALVGVAMASVRSWRAAWPLLGGVLLALIVVSTRVIDRPENLALCLIAFYLLILARVAGGAGRRVVWLLPLMQVVWVNVHASFVMGPTVIGLALLAQMIAQGLWLKPRAIMRLPEFKVLVLCCAVLPLNPWGVHYWRYLYQFRDMEILRSFAAEWHASDLLGFEDQRWRKAAFWLLLTLSGAGALTAIGRRPRSLFPGLVLVLFTAMALSVRRYGVFFAVAALFALAHGVVVWTKAGSPLRSRAQLGASFLVLSLALGATWALLNGAFYRWLELPVRAGVGLDLAYVPERVVRFMKEAGLSQRFFNTYDFGGYLILARQPVFIDGRVTDYDPEFLRTARRFIEGDPATIRALSEQWQLELALLGVGNDMPLIQALLRLPDWHPIYFDANAVLFARRTPSLQAIIERYGIDKPERMDALMASASYYWPHEAPSDALKRSGFPMEQWQLGMLYQAFGMHAAAERELRKGLKLAPYSESLYRELILTLIRSGQAAPAVEAILAILPHVKANTDIYRTLAELYHALGKTSEALVHYRKALELSPAPVPSILRALAILHHGLGDSSQAQAMARRYLASPITPAEAQQFRQEYPELVPSL